MDSSLPIKINTPPHGIAWGRFIQGISNFLIFIIIAAIAIPACLGYRVNWEAHTIEQTGLIELSGPENSLPFHIYVNGELQQGGMPFRLSWVFPGTYTLEVRADGYQTWQQVVEVDKNMRVSFRNFILVYQTPLAENISPLPTKDDINHNLQSSNGISVSNGNQIYVNGEYITSTSQNLLSARWYTDRDHIIYQNGNELTLYDLKSDTTQHLVTLSSKVYAPYELQDGGRVLIYVDGNRVKAVSLFQPVSLIDRLAIGH